MTDIAIPAPSHDAEATAPPPRVAVPDFQIVPRAGLVLVAIVLVALIVAIAANKLWPLTFFHVAVRRGVDDHRPLPRAGARPDHRADVGSGADRVHHPADAEDAADHAGRSDRDARRRLAARGPRGHRPDELSRARLGRGQLHRGRRDVGARARPARAGQHRRAGRAQEAPAQPAGDRAAHEAVHLLRRDPRSHAGRDARDHDQAGLVG